MSKNANRNLEKKGQPKKDRSLSPEEAVMFLELSRLKTQNNKLRNDRRSSNKQDTSMDAKKEK